MKKGLKLADGSVFLRTPRKNRGKSISQLQSIGFNSPNSERFNRESDLATHLAKRISATIDKRQTLVSLLYAENRKSELIQVGGALVQDRSGKSSSNKSLFTGTQAGHVAIGTYSIGGKIISQQGLRLLQQKSAYEPTRIVYPDFSSLISLSLILDAKTELVPAYINQASGKIESKTIPYMKGLLPIYIPDNPGQLERQLIAESYRILDFFINKKITFVAPIEKRLKALESGKANEQIQDPNDRENLIFDGKESIFLEAVRALIKDSSSDFYKELNFTEINIPIQAADLAEQAEGAKEEIAQTPSTPSSDGA
ncbi:MAG: hypothetical protein KDJ34_10750 [Candidatus Competibacteraceae bacterium]|nr:hypothetical protein [Candidatus Competibacteraceae bacterium]